MQPHRPSLLQTFVHYCIRTSNSKGSVVSPPKPKGIYQRSTIHQKIKNKFKANPNPIKTQLNPLESKEKRQKLCLKTSKIFDARKILSISQAVFYNSMAYNRKNNMKTQSIAFNRRYFRSKSSGGQTHRSNSQQVMRKNATIMPNSQPDIGLPGKTRPYSAQPVCSSINRLRSIQIQFGNKDKKLLDAYEQGLSGWQTRLQ